MRDVRIRRGWYGTIMATTVVTVLAVLISCENFFGDQNGADTETYTISYEANGASSGTIPEVQTKIEGVELTLATNSGNLERTGDTFLGWNTAADGSGTDYAEGALYTDDADMTLFPRWSPLYQAGDTGPAGGTVFYDKGEYTDDWRYMEAWTANEAGNHHWKWPTSNNTPGTSTVIGSGYDNTYTAMTGIGHPAAEVVRNATHGGYSDWFLPSRDELNEMYENLFLEGLGGLPVGRYWSSSQFNDQGAWMQYFGDAGPYDDGEQFSMTKAQDYPVRAVRRF